MVSICGFICALMLSDAERQQHADAFARTQQQTQTYQADLKQTVRLRGLKRPAESIGKIYYKAPSSLRIEFSQPAGEYMLVTGDEVYLKKSNRALVHRKNTDPNTRMLLSLFQGNVKNWEENFQITHAREDDRLVVNLRGKQIEIENVIALPSYDVQSVQVRFDQDNSMTYEFTNPVRNAPLDDKLFEPSDFDRKL